METLTKHISRKCKCRFDGRKCNSDQWCNNNCRCECKKPDVREQDLCLDLATFNCKYGKYLASIMDNSAIICNKVIKSYNEDAEPKSYDKTKLNEKKAICKMQNFYILLALLLIAIALLIAVSTNCYLTKYQAKQKHLLPFHFTNNELKE